jgi:hypothetical protein
MFKNSNYELNQVFLIVVINISISTTLDVSLLAVKKKGILQNYSVDEMRS